MKVVVGCAKDTQRTEGLSVCLIIVEYACDEYCDMLLPDGARNSQVGTEA